jgi:hypothetical protein
VECRHRLLSLAAVAITSLLVAGCGGDEEQPVEPVELEETLGFSDEGIMERQTRVEGRIRDCMKAQGFDYVPVDPFAEQQALTGKARQTEEEFIEQFGYGISTLFGRGSPQSDPNERIRKSLLAADRRAYDRTLWGEHPGVTFREAVDSGDFSELGGCTKQATDEEFGGEGVASKLVAKFDVLDERIIQDQRMVRANEKWSECMREKGYEYEEPDAIDGDLEGRFKAIVGSEVRPDTSTPPPGITYDRARLDDLQREEVEIANADLDCERREITPVELVVRPQYETEFRQNAANAKLIRTVRPPGR